MRPEDTWGSRLGLNPEEHLGKPVIGILNTWNELTPCHLHLRERAEQVKRGVWQAGGFPVEFPLAAPAETDLLLYRNLLAMAAEEILRSHRVDGVVLMGGCGETTPALLMGAASTGLPSIFVPAGPMLDGYLPGDEHHCTTLGSASTMTSAAEALGMTLPGAASIPAADSAHHRMAAASGARIVTMVRAGLTISRVLDQRAFADAATAVLALGGSPDAFIHLIAIARRLGIPLGLDDFDSAARRTPVLADVRPRGRYLMENFHRAGGLPALLSRVTDLLHTDRITVSGQTFGETLANARVLDEKVLRPRADPIAAEAGIAVLRGNLAPDGAVLDYRAAEPKLLWHTGPAVVFENLEDLGDRINAPELDITEDSVLVLRGSGPLGGPGMPGYDPLPIPDRLRAAGVRDLVRISDARLSGGTHGTCVRHVSPESHAGGPLALVRDGDLITLDVPGRSLRLEVTTEELARRRAGWRPPAPRYTRGYGALYARHVTQADVGCDFAFLTPSGGNPGPDAR